MSVSLIRELERAQKRKSSGRKKKAKRKTAKRRRKPAEPKVKIKFRTKTIVKRVYVRAKSSPAARHPRKKRAKSSKKKGGKLSKAEFLRRMAAGRAKAKRARKR